jgi:hypothetical protein
LHQPARESRARVVSFMTPEEVAAIVLGLEKLNAAIPPKLPEPALYWRLFVEPPGEPAAAMNACHTLPVY